MKKINRIWICSLALVGALLIFTSSCTKSGDPTAPMPVLTTSKVTNITSSTASCGGIIISDGGSTITARGVCWSTVNKPTIADSKTIDGTGVGTFLSTLTGLSCRINGTKYYVRAYATTNAGTGYGSAMSFTTKPGGSAGTVTDIDGNVYQTIIIGKQVWMAENLKTTKYRDGSPIPNITDENVWDEFAIGAYCNYNYDAALGAKYGKLYNWHVVTSTKNLAPTGWHIPTDAEWTTMENHLIANGYNYDGTTTDDKLAQALAATTDWENSNGDNGPNAPGYYLGLNNSSGFTALPGGSYVGGGTFYRIGYYGTWWSSTENGGDSAWCRSLGYSNPDLYRYDDWVCCNFFSVRCVRDSPF